MMIILGAITDKASLASCLSSWVYGAHCFDLVFDSLDFGNFMWNSTKIAKTLKKLISGRNVWLSTKMNFLVLVDLKNFSFFSGLSKAQSKHCARLCNFWAVFSFDSASNPKTRAFQKIYIYQQSRNALRHSGFESYLSRNCRSLLFQS